MRLIDADALKERHCGDCNPEVRAMCEKDPICATMQWIIDEPTVEPEKDET